MTHEDLNEVLLHAVPNAWTKLPYLQGWYFNMKTYKEHFAMFKRMEIFGKVRKGRTPSKTPIMEDSNCDRHVRKRKGGEAASPTNREKGRAGKRKIKNTGHPSDASTSAKKSCILHGPGCSSEECKRPKIYSEITPYSGLIKINKPTPAANLSVVNLSSSTEIHQNPMSWRTMMVLSLIRKKIY